MFGKMIIAADQLGGNYNLKYQGEERYKTVLGGILTLFSVFVFMGIFFMIGIDFYLRINPQVTMSKTLSSEYFNYTLNKTNFLFAFRIESDGKLFMRPDLFYIEPHYIVFNQTEKGMKKIVDEIIPFHKCDYSDANYNEVYNSSVMSQFLCLNHPSGTEGYDGGGLYDAKYIRYFKIKFSHCSAGEKYNKANNITCSQNNKEINYLFTKTALYVKYIIQSYYVDSHDYYDPFKLSFDSMYQTMEFNIQKKIYFYFKKGVLNDNKGWILDDRNEKEFIGLDRQRLDVRDGSSDYNTNVFYEINLYFDRIIENFNRKYQKVQDVLAAVGGLMKIISFIFGNFVIYYNQHHFYIKILNDVLLKNINQKEDISSRHNKFDLGINKLKLKNNNKINNNNPGNNYNSNSLIDLNRASNLPNINSNSIVINQNESNIQAINDNKETVLNNQKTLKHETKFKKIKSVSVFRKKMDKFDKVLNANTINLKNSPELNNEENILAKSVDAIKLSFLNYVCYYLMGRCRRKSQNFINFIKYSLIAGKHMDISKILEFFIKYEPLIDQLMMSNYLNCSSHILLNN